MTRASDNIVDQYSQVFESAINVSMADIEAAKAFVVEVLRRPQVRATRHPGFVEKIVDDWLATVGCERRRDITEAELEAAGATASKLLAIGFAINDLVARGVVCAETPTTMILQYAPRISALGSQVHLFAPHGPHAIAVPEKLCASPLRHTELADPSLYLGTVAIEGLHEGVKVALAQAVECFRSALYLPCLAMLCTAIEGAWIELARWHGGKLATDAERDNLRETARKVAAALKRMGPRGTSWPTRLEDVYQWTLRLQDERNAVHYAVATGPTSYEITATMLLCAPAHLRTLYEVREAVPDGS